MSAPSFEEIARRRKARLRVQHGSSVGGRTHAGSDVDVAVLFDGEPASARVGGLLADLEEAFAGRDVDLGLLNHADPLFLKKVLESARLLAGSAREMVLIADDLRRREALAARSREVYLASDVDETLAERCLERMIGRMTDVNYHVLTESGEAPPRDCFESFTALARIGALPADFAAGLAPWGPEPTEVPQGGRATLSSSQARYGAWPPAIGRATSSGTS